jgi:hypothetical protein
MRGSNRSLRVDIVTAMGNSMRHGKLWRVILAGAALAVLALSRVEGSDTASSDRRVGLIIDPTVFRASESAQFDDLTNALGQLLESPQSVPEGAEVDVWIVGLGSLANSGPDVHKEFTFAPNALATAHPKNLKDWITKTLSPKLKESWHAAHSTAGASSPRSCILTSLYRAATYFNEHRDSKTTSLVVISDFLEVCDEWGPKVNLEQQPATTIATSATQAQTAIQFKNTKSITAILLPSQQTQTPLKQIAVRNAWIDVFRRLASGTQTKVLTSIPEQLAAEY